MPVQDNRILQFKSPLADDRCAISALSGSERLNDLFSFDVTLVVDGSPLKPEDLLGEAVSVKIAYGGHERTIQGVVCEFTEIDPYGDNTFEYRVVVVPKLWLLQLSSHHQMFEDMTAVDIVRQVVKDGCGMSVTTRSMHSEYRRREICCQYGETDLAFVTRLLAEEGIGFYFEDDQLVLSGKMGGFVSCGSYPYNERDSSEWKQRVSRFKQAGRLCTGKLVSTDYSEYTPSRPVAIEVKSTVKPNRLRPGEMAVHGRHDFESSNPERALPTSSCKDQAGRWLDGLEAEGAEFHGESGAAMFAAGHCFTLEDAPVSANKQTEFLLTEVVHNATEGLDSGSYYGNTFQCVATSNKTAFTPAPPAAVPRVWGPQTAKVVEVLNPETAGAHGAVKVAFPWNTEQNSCWARVAQLYAGNKWGSFFIPDVGQEVVVEFLNGDPDRPLVVGAVYNEDNKIPPYTKWQSGIKTRSDEYNELRFDDNPGSEEVYFQAGKDHNFLVKNDEKGEIKSNQQVKVGSNQKLEVGAKQTVKVGSDQKQTIGSNQELKVGQNSTQKVGQKLVIDAGTEIELKANASITLKVGASEIKIDPVGVTINGTMVKIKGNALTEVTSSAMLMLKGALAKIN